MKIVLIGVFIFSFVFLYSCGDKQQAERGKILSAEKMQIVLWDVLQADAFTQNFVKKDSSKRDTIENAALQRKIFELHKITKEDFYSSYNFYAAQPDVMKKMLDSIAAKAERNRGKLMMDRYGNNKTLPAAR